MAPSIPIVPFRIEVAPLDQEIEMVARARYRTLHNFAVYESYVRRCGEKMDRKGDLMIARARLGPLSPVDHAALVRLCNLKKVIRRDDGYGTQFETLISSASAAMLKKRNLAVTGWSRDMYPTKSGHAFAAGKNIAP
jgi:hypothetical protein